jgi:hypothetical protein
LPRCAPSKRLLYEKQTKTPDSFRLLLFEVLHGIKVFKNEEEALRKGIIGFPYSLLPGIILKI